MHLVTGGLGFIGNELVRQLKAAGQNVAVIDNRNRVAPRIEDLRDVPVHEIDLTDHAKVRAIIADIRPEVVYHLAAIHFIPECNGDPERTLRVNVEATQGILRACVQAKVRHTLVASSGAVYADSPEALSESSRVAPVDIYGWSKWFTEELCGWHAAQSGLKITALRLFNNYGPRETNAHIIPEIISQLRQGDTLRLGNIKPRRDYIHTSDTAKALRLLAARVPDSLRTVNVASGQHASVEELIEVMGELLGRRLVVETDPARFRQADKLVQVADLRALEAAVGWKPEINFKTGLKNLLQFEGLIP
jgi:UDP-glucose 4-epimerase